METYDFELPCGLFINEQTTHKDVTLKPVTAKERRIIADIKNRNNIGRLTTSLLSSVIVKIGDIDQVTESTIRKMLIADRDFCLYKLRMISRKDDFIVDFKCSSVNCGSTYALKIGMDEVDEYVKSIPLQNYDEIINGKRGFIVEHNGIKGKFIFPDGYISERVGDLRKLEANPILVNYEYIAVMCEEWGGKLSGLSVDLLESMPDYELDELEEAIKDRAAVGPDFTVSSPCPRCGQENEGRIDFLSFLLPSGSTGGKQKRRTV